MSYKEEHERFNCEYWQRLMKKHHGNAAAMAEEAAVTISYIPWVIERYELIRTHRHALRDFYSSLGIQQEHL